VIFLSLRELAINQNKKGKNKGRISNGKQSRYVKQKGYRAEKELVKKLRSWGFKAVRIPVSAPSSEPLPDVFAIKGDSILAFEVKSHNNEKVYFRKNQIKKLIDFLNMFELYPYKHAILCVKFYRKWIFKKIEKIENSVINKNEKNSFALNK
jgi:Holliday junction resolvase